MKIIRIVLSLLCSLFLVSCWWTGPNEPDYEPYQGYQAIVLDRLEFENAVQIMPPQDVVNAGKIYIKEEFLFVNEVNKGFHVFEYSNPQTPVPVAFIAAPGATDLALRADVLYMNQAVDLVAIRYNPNSNTISITKRNRNVFPQKTAPDFSYANITENQIIVDWIPNN